MESVESRRLIGRKLLSEDLGILRQFHSDPLVMVELGGVRDEKKSKENLEWNLRHWQCHGFGLSVIEAKDSGLSIGLAGFREVEFLGALEIDLAYMLLPKFWKQGFATEISQTLVTHAFKGFEFPSIISKTRVSNSSSQRVALNLGFAFEREAVEYGFPHYQYRLTIDQWRSRT